MRFATQKYFDRDWARLKPEHQRQFITVVRGKFIPACDAWAKAADAGLPFVWPESLRVSPIANGGGIMEMTWSFASPDGRATFHLGSQDDEWICYWRRIGDHGVFEVP